MRPTVFTVEQRERARDRILEMAHADARVIAGAIVGSEAAGHVDRWSDVDLTFGLAPGVTAADVLADWTRQLETEFEAVHLFDLPYLSTVYRVFLFPGTLQVDVSFTPGAEFGALGPRFKLLFGSTVERAHAKPPAAAHLFGLAAHHAVRVRFCIERGRLWQAEYLLSHLRHDTMTLACLRHGLDTAHGRGFDRLPTEAIAQFREGLPRSLDRDELLRALGATIECLLGEGRYAVPGTCAALEKGLRDLTKPGWPGEEGAETPRPPLEKSLEG
jgi:hypothetical protein